MVEILSSAVGVAIVTGLFKLLEMCLNHRARRKDDEKTTTAALCQARGDELKKLSEKVDALVGSEIVSMGLRIKNLATKYIDREYITVEEFEDLDKMYQTYKRLGGNGFIKNIMNDIYTLSKRAK